MYRLRRGTNKSGPTRARRKCNVKSTPRKSPHLGHPIRSERIDLSDPAVRRPAVFGMTGKNLGRKAGPPPEAGRLTPLAKRASGFGMTIFKLRMAIYFFRRERTRGSSVMGTKSPGRRQVYTSALVAPDVAAAPETSSFCKMKTPCWPGSNLGALTQATSRESGKRRTILFLLSFGPLRTDWTCRTASCQLALCSEVR